MIKIMIFFYKFCDNKHAAPFYIPNLSIVFRGGELAYNRQE